MIVVLEVMVDESGQRPRDGGGSGFQFCREGGKRRD